jgi:hypothetical protein
LDTQQSCPKNKENRIARERDDKLPGDLSADEVRSYHTEEFT